MTKAKAANSHLHYKVTYRVISQVGLPTDVKEVNLQIPPDQKLLQTLLRPFTAEFKARVVALPPTLYVVTENQKVKVEPSWVIGDVQTPHAYFVWEDPNSSLVEVALGFRSMPAVQDWFTRKITIALLDISQTQVCTALMNIFNRPLDQLLENPFTGVTAIMELENRTRRAMDGQFNMTSVKKIKITDERRLFTRFPVMVTINSRVIPVFIEKGRKVGDILEQLVVHGPDEEPVVNQIFFDGIPKLLNQNIDDLKFTVDSKFTINGVFSVLWIFLGEKFRMFFSLNDSTTLDQFISRYYLPNTTGHGPIVQIYKGPLNPQRPLNGQKYLAFGHSCVFFYLRVAGLRRRYITDCMEGLRFAALSHEENGEGIITVPKFTIQGQNYILELPF